MVNPISDTGAFVHMALERTTNGSTSGLLLLTLSLFAEDSPTTADIESQHSLHARLVLYRDIWEHVLLKLYKTHLPSAQRPTASYPEITSATVLMGAKEAMANENLTDVLTALDLQDATPAELGDFLGPIKSDPRFDFSGLSRLPAGYAPTGPAEELAIILYLADFPPLRSLGMFYQSASSALNSSMRELEAQLGTAPSPKINMGLPLALHSSLFPFGRELLKMHSLADMAKIEKLSDLSSALTELGSAKTKHATVVGHHVCPKCSHEATNIDLGPIDSHWLSLMRRPRLSNAVGLALLHDVGSLFRQSVRHRMEEFLSSLHFDGPPDGIILVEGRSESEVIPVLSFKMEVHLRDMRIRVFDAEGKEQVPKQLRILMKQMPQVPIVVLLDSDAMNEETVIQRMIRGKSNKYDVFRLKTGTIEDIFPPRAVAEALQQMFPDGDRIEEVDIDPAREILAQVPDLLWEKKKAQFTDKREFCRTAAWATNHEEIYPMVAEAVNRLILLMQASLPFRLAHYREE